MTYQAIDYPKCKDAFYEQYVKVKLTAYLQGKYHLKKSNQDQTVYYDPITTTKQAIQISIKDLQHIQPIDYQKYIPVTMPTQVINVTLMLNHIAELSKSSMPSTAIKANYMDQISEYKIYLYMSYMLSLITQAKNIH